MNSKNSILFTSLAIFTLAAPVAMAGGRGQHSAARVSSISASRPTLTGPQSQLGAPSRTQPQMKPGVLASNARHPGGRGDHDWRHRHHHHHHDVFFFGNFGYPFYGFGYGYPYAYRSGYPYYSYGYDPYDYSSDNDAAPLDASLVLQVQRKLARAGYYHGAIDGVIGAGTRSAVRAYERSHRLPVDGVIDDDLLATMGLA